MIPTMTMTTRPLTPGETTLGLENNLPVLYILLRNDMASMTPGRAAAQASHVTSNFHQTMDHLALGPIIGDLYVQWKTSTPQNFGTAIVLGIRSGDLETRIVDIQRDGFLADIVNDPTYAVKDGDTVHYVSVNVGGWVFGTKGDLYSLLGSLPLFGCEGTSGKP